MTRAIFGYYKQGLQRLIAAIGEEHPQVATLRILQQRLVENLGAPASADRPATERATAHADILDTLNRLCLELTGKPFSTFCETVPDTTASAVAARETVLSFAEYIHWLTSLATREKVPLPATQAMIQERTLAVLEHSTPKEKGQILQTLYNAGLISTPTPTILLARADLKRVHLVEAEMNGVHLAEADMQGANLVAALLKEANLSRAILVGANLSWSTLAQSRLVETELGGATLTGVDLRAADAHGANLIMANLKRADLSQANFSRTNLLRANLEEAILTAADLSGAVLLWTNLSHARLDGAKLDGATYNQYTIWPEEFDPAASGAVKAD
ncbi:MAG TPA: pentapeptide repeat-containing protein [Anaerolineae bacterium]|nr:pentapeptide repeat-containing protein [Anaerolineae bacterium]HQK14398.1 pentapeptide repeat-containing protein [Anaerolineae bacterium]